MHNLTTTIAAISTPPGKGGVALIRVSGPDAVSISEKVFFPMSGKKLSLVASNRTVYGNIVSENEIIDDGMATVFRSPHSYTGEDTVEITCHGGILLTHTVLTSLLTAGAVLADPGEYTERAFVSGRLSLSDAEGIAGLLDAQSRAEIRLSAVSSRTRLSATVDALRHSLTAVMASLFAAIDFPDEDLASLSHDEIIASLCKIEGEIKSLLATYRTGRAVTEGIKTAIVGRPNVGKSSLYNMLAGDDLAIVTDIPGTTRDILTETVSLGKVKLRLSDTAGMRETGDAVEKIGVSRSRNCMESCELCLAVFDASQSLVPEDLELIESLKTISGTVIAVLNKTDLPSADMSIILGAFPNRVSLSAKFGSADSLSALVEKLFTDEKLTIGEDAILSGERQHAALNRAEEYLAMAIASAFGGYPEDIIAGDLERSIGALGELDGRAVSEDVVSEIFSHFCVGK